MSPEQLEGQRVDARSDVYATGVLMYKLATGRLPFVSGTVADRLGPHLSVVPRGPTELKGIPQPVDIAAVDWH